MKSIMITAPSSNTGKTIITLGMIRALKNRGLDVSAFKTGPDFIDTKYLGLAAGKKAGNLDMHLQGKDGLSDALSMNVGGFAVIEGAMGYFDGIYNTFENSSYDISRHIDIPSILVYTPKGQMFSAVTNIKGMVDFSQSRIKGIILNQTSESMYILLKERIEEHIDVEVLGYLPVDDSLKIEDRSLGLISPEENPRIQETINNAAKRIERAIDIDGVIDLSKEIRLESYEYPAKRDIDLAIAYDDAFNFYYQENLNLLENICRVKYFSPIKDKKLPKADMVYIGGGYPELHKEELSNNREMISAIKSYAEDGGYIYGEAGGLMYLANRIKDSPMCGIIRGRAIMTDRLQRFGYVNIELNRECLLGAKGDRITGQEFHRSILKTHEQEIFTVTKPMSQRDWQCAYQYKNVLACYQHINFLGNIKALNHLLDRVENKDKDGSNVYKKSYGDRE